MDINGNSFEQAVRMSLMTTGWWGGRHINKTDDHEYRPAEDGGLARFAREKRTPENRAALRQAITKALEWMSTQYPGIAVDIRKDGSDRTAIIIHHHDRSLSLPI